MTKTEKLRKEITRILKQPVKIDILTSEKRRTGWKGLEFRNKDNERVEQILKACKEQLIFRDGSEIDL